ncbi:MAG: nucleotide exchange factor GrpE [Candidatus Delongbacteria bacterium]|nr:nucleotide exchange factor GrpE [Candidatus Delongbacteria bacterium]MBN2836115.1 nucleotide exchange factor GrpE [Candidatus Delongbacteria bacterium]
MNTIDHEQNEQDLNSKKINSNTETYFDEILSEINRTGFYSELEDLDKEMMPGIDELWTSGNKVDNYSTTQLSPKIEEEFSKINMDISEIKNSLANLSQFFKNQKNTESSSINDLNSNLIIFKNDFDDSQEKLVNYVSELGNETKIRDRAFEKLYEQLEMYKKNFYFSLLKPFITDLVLFYDRINENLNNSFVDENYLSTLIMFKEELLEILFRNGIVPIEKSEPGDKFDPRKSNAIKRIYTEDKNLDQCVEKVLLEGFTFEDKQFRPETVVIYKYKKNEEEDSESKSESFDELDEILDNEQNHEVEK